MMQLAKTGAFTASPALMRQSTGEGSLMTIDHVISGPVHLGTVREA
jgi:hypothetical protein